MGKKYIFKLHEYPYVYQCDNCKLRFKITQEQERSIKEEWNVNDPLPLFFECDRCHSIRVRPIGYDGEQSFTIFH